MNHGIIPNKLRRTWIVLFSFLMILVFQTSEIRAQDLIRIQNDPFRSPWDIETTSQPELDPGNSYFQDAGSAAIQFYRVVLNPAFSTGCPSHPSCSEYASQAIVRFGLIAGTVLALERLIHESSEIELGRMIITDAGPKIFDPLDANTCWLPLAPPGVE